MCSLTIECVLLHTRITTATRRRNKDVIQADNNILLFGQWYRKKHNVQGELPAPRKPGVFFFSLVWEQK